MLPMSANSNTPPSAASVSVHGPILDARTRLRLGLQLQALYEPVLDEVLDPRLAELLQQLETDREATDVGQ
ncbi:Anti-sigma factor NepR domain-containing protein [Methylorubrum aminovorans]